MIGDGKEPCSREFALARMQALTMIKSAEYQLGTGNYHKASYGVELGAILPVGFASQYDCAGAAMCEAFMLTRHRPGFAKGSPPYEYLNDVDDDINTNSGLEDAFNKQELFEFVIEDTVDGIAMLPGDLVMWATIHLKGTDGEIHTFIGHVLMAKSIPPGWKPEDGFYRCRFLQCCGGNGRKPAVIETDGSVIDAHNRKWPKPGMKAYVVRVKQRVG